VGEARGYGVTGLLGGIISSTAVTLTFARHSRREPALSPALAAGVLAACTVLLVRVSILTTVLNPPVTWALGRYVLPPLVVGAVFVTLAVMRRAPEPDGAAEPRTHSPLGLWSALKMAVGFQVVLTALPFVQQLWGTSGVRASAVFLGATDMDALTLSMCRLAAAPQNTGLAANAIAIGILSNTVLKLGVALVLGSGAFRRWTAPGLAALALASVLGLWLARGVP
jgi:uncharacterized membrane protein (DUF4010 family)